MRVFICFEGSWESFDVPPDQTVGTMKQMVKVIEASVLALLMVLNSLISFDF